MTSSAPKPIIDPKPGTSAPCKPSSSSSKLCNEHSRLPSRQQNKIKKTFHDDSSTDSESLDATEEIPYVSTDNKDSEDDAECSICGKPYSSDKMGEKWIQCTKCFKWCHELCSSDNDRQMFICDICFEG